MGVKVPRSELGGSGVTVAAWCCGCCKGLGYCTCKLLEYNWGWLAVSTAAIKTRARVGIVGSEKEGRKPLRLRNSEESI